MSIRSALFVPAHRRDLVEKAQRTAADAVVLDCQDSVPESHRPAARAVLRSLPKRTGIVAVRTSAVESDAFAADLDAAVAARARFVVLPDVKQPDELVEADACASARERAHGVEPGSVQFLPIAESARGVRALYDILLASPRVVGTAFAGARDGDLANDLGCTPSGSGLELLYARSKVLLDARAAGAEIVLDGVFVDLSADEALRSDSELGRNLGYTGRMVVHPRQVAIVNEVYAPGDDEIEEARRLIERFREAEANGLGAIRDGDRLVDYAMVRRAEQLLARRGELR